jgi:hypothetical protein
MSKANGWAMEDDAMLRSMAANGASAADIGERLGRSRNSVCGRAWRLGVALRGVLKSGGKERLVGKKRPRPRVAKVRLAPRVAQPVVEEAAVTPPTKLVTVPADAVSWDALKDGCCKWPIEGMFCGAVAMPRKSYCPQHTYQSKAAPAVVPTMPKQRRAVGRYW